MKYERQRPTRGSTLGKLVLMLRMEMFIPATTIVFAIGKGIKKTLLDGYHRMTVLADYVGSMQFVEVVYRCSSKQAMHNLYTCIDTGIGKRLPSDMYAAYAGPQAAEQIGRAQVKRLIIAVRFIADLFSQSVAKVQISSTLMYCVIADHFIKPMGKMMTLMADDMHGLETQTVLQQSVLSVALVTLKYYPARACEFWGAIFRDDEMMTSDPRYICRKFLIGLQATTERKGNGARGQQTPRAKSYVVSFCWDKFCRDESMLGIDIESIAKGSKVFIAHTPFSANKTTDQLRQALVDLGLCEEHLEYMQEAVKLSKTRYNSKRPRGKKRAKTGAAAQSVDINVSVKARQRNAG